MREGICLSRWERKIPEIQFECERWIGGNLEDGRAPHEACMFSKNVISMSECTKMMSNDNVALSSPKATEERREAPATMLSARVLRRLKIPSPGQQTT